MEVHNLSHQHALDCEAVLGLGSHVDGVLPLVAGTRIVGVEHLVDRSLQRGRGVVRRRLLLLAAHIQQNREYDAEEESDSAVHPNINK